MKICFKIDKNTISKKEIELVKKFCSLLMKKMKLSKDLTIEFLSERYGEMTTGSFVPNKNKIKILSKDRMFPDILRTLSHEWGHAYDHEKIKIKDRRDIGGKSEDLWKFKIRRIYKNVYKKK